MRKRMPHPLNPPPHQPSPTSNNLLPLPFKIPPIPLPHNPLHKPLTLRTKHILPPRTNQHPFRHQFNPHKPGTHQGIIQPHPPSTPPIYCRQKYPHRRIYLSGVNTNTLLIREHQRPINLGIPRHHHHPPETSPPHSGSWISDNAIIAPAENPPITMFSVSINPAYSGSERIASISRAQSCTWDGYVYRGDLR
ncbi:hypothetical protein K440DRAFT_57462 [Wilcoxina mikolae CBS 423.85]|nr:hypothetical protein K440DRAFT_57462 [Wilcoxina mikolae CBS 423.85]